MDKQRYQAVGHAVLRAVMFAKTALENSGVTLAEVQEMQVEAQMEEGKFNALGPILDPTTFKAAGEKPYEAVHKRLQLAALALDPKIAEGNRGLYQKATEYGPAGTDKD